MQYGNYDNELHRPLSQSSQFETLNLLREHSKWSFGSFPYRDVWPAQEIVPLSKVEVFPQWRTENFESLTMDAVAIKATSTGSFLPVWEYPFKT